MQLHLEGTNSIASPRENVYSLLTDPGFISKSLPDAEEVRVLDATSLEARMKLRIAVVSTALKMKMTIEKTAPPSKATLLAEGAGSGSALKIRSAFELSGDATTNIAWAADAEITGVMAGIGSTLLRGFAAKKVAEIFSDITRAIEAASR
ncbi:MAG TPA: SRPBCC domain-containing protein [Nitrososphaerales archaeon]|nr:SRPBCC domain-containing protein [Nitrososphaerales archaeon]